MILEPGIFIEAITTYLAQVERIKISALVVIMENGASTPIGMAPAVFVLQAIPERNISQAFCGSHICNELDRA